MFRRTAQHLFPVMNGPDRPRAVRKMAADRRQEYDMRNSAGLHRLCGLIHALPLFRQPGRRAIIRRNQQIDAGGSRQSSGHRRNILQRGDGDLGTFCFPCGALVRRAHHDTHRLLTLQQTLRNYRTRMACGTKYDKPRRLPFLLLRSVPPASRQPTICRHRLPAARPQSRSRADDTRILPPSAARTSS